MREQVISLGTTEVTTRDYIEEHGKLVGGVVCSAETCGLDRTANFTPVKKESGVTRGQTRAVCSNIVSCPKRTDDTPITYIVRTKA